MFGWFQRKQDPKQTRAYQLGRDMAERFANDLEKLMEIRFKPWAEGYLDVLQGQLNKCLNPANAPPIIVAKIEYKIFSERVVERHDEMIADVTGVLSEHLAVADQVQMRDKFDELRRVLIKSRMVTATCSMSALAHCGRHIEEHLSECCPMPGRDCSTVTRTSFGNSRAPGSEEGCGLLLGRIEHCLDPTGRPFEFLTVQASKASDLDVR